MTAEADISAFLSAGRPPSSAELDAVWPWQVSEEDPTTKMLRKKLGSVVVNVETANMPRGRAEPGGC